MDVIKEWIKKYIKPDAWILGLSYGGICYILISASNIKGEGVPELMVIMDITFFVIFLINAFAHHFKNQKSGVSLLIGGLLLFAWSFFKIARYQYGLI